MPTQLRSIFGNLARWQFTVASEVVTSPFLLQLEDYPFSGLCPYRIISPALNRAESELTGQGFGNSYEALRTIDDLLLWRSILEVPSFSDVVMPLMDYMAMYEEKWVTNRQITPNAFIETVKPFTAGVFKYPAGTETQYYGVLATLIIRENVDG
jgi:hypothetical protein